ncbi:MAG: protein kinase [Planctomycetes bacterium]|nr:protein kinase [Planctomycetota bacterium]
MPDLSIDCPACGEANMLPVESDQESFTCVKCGETASIDSAVQTGTEKQPDYLVGEIISDCKILKKVGEGGFGSVYKAHDQNLQRTVALKVMLPSLTTNVQFVQNFVREAVTAAQINHPNIVAIHKVGRDERRGIHYLIMEFVEGETLADIVHRKGVLGWQEAMPIYIQSCDALATAHERNIVHRDIKPENLMLDKSGLVKITDFGLAKSLSSDHKTTKVMGTPHYMSPEQFEGKSVDGRSDIYSLGVTFYYLLSKSRPYEGQNTVQIIYAILTQQPKALTELNKDVPQAVWAVIEKMISKRPEDRYQSLRETIVDLKKLQGSVADDKSGCAQCGTKNPKSRKFCRSCGAALVVPCPACGSPEAAGAKSCSGCGADLEKLVRTKTALDAAKRFQAMGDLRLAADGYRQVLQLDAGHAEAKAEVERIGATLAEVERVANQTQEMMRTGDIESALGAVEELLRRYPSSNEVKSQRDEMRKTLADRKVSTLVADAEALASQSRLREAMESLDQALRVDPSREDIRAVRADYGKRVATAAENRQKAAEALAGGRYEEAYQLASDVQKILPGDSAMEDLRRRAQSSVESVDQFVSRGQAKLAAKRYGDALSEFEAALSLRPSETRVLKLVSEARQRIAEQRERVANARRLMADRQFRDAVKLLQGVLEETPDDLEAKSLLTSCERGVHESDRLAEIDQSLEKAAKLEAAGETAKSLELLQRVQQIDPDNETARTRREQIERKFREESALRELADEHLADGMFPEAVETLQRLKSVNAAKSASFDKEIVEAKRSHGQVKASLERSEQALAAKEYRRAGEAAQQVLAVAPKHPRAVAIKKDCDKAVAAIDRFLAECDKYLATEMFDEALDALDKAKDRGATPEEHKHRREACEQGRLALLKTDATRSLMVKDFDAAIAAYQNVLEVKKDDADALKGKRAAERRVLILTSEPLSLRLGTAAMVLLSLGLLQYSAIASTRDVAVDARVQANRDLDAAKTIVKDVRKLEADLAPAQAAEAAGNWKAAGAAYAAEFAQFSKDPRLATGRDFAVAIQNVDAGPDPVARLRLLAAAQAFLGDEAAPRKLREDVIAKLRDDFTADAMKSAAALEATDATAALARYRELVDDPVGRTSKPAMDRIEGLQGYLNYLKVAELKESQGNFKGAASSYFNARAAVGGDAGRADGVTARLDRLRGRWLDAVRARARAAGTDDVPYYEGVVQDLAEMVRTLGLPREQLLDEFNKGMR